MREVSVGHIDLSIDCVHRPGDLGAFEVFLFKKDSDTGRMFEARTIEYKRGSQVVPDIKPPQVYRSLWARRLTHSSRVPKKQISSPRLRIRNSVRIEFGRRKLVLAVISVHEKGNAHLTKVVQTAYLLALLFGARQRRKEHPGENSDDSDNDQELDQREASDRLVETRATAGVCLATQC